jgi:hypothetical protein
MHAEARRLPAGWHLEPVQKNEGLEHLAQVARAEPAGGVRSILRLFRDGLGA